MSIQKFSVTRGCVRRFAWAACGCLLLGCNPLKGLRTDLENTTTLTVDVLNDAIAAIEAQSSSWQTVLQDAQGKLTSDAQATIRNELTVLSGQTLAMAGAQARCVVDHAGTRAVQGLRAIRAKLLRQPVEVPEPFICQVTPVAVDRAAVPEHIRLLQFDGFDMGPGIPLTLQLERSSGPPADVTGMVDWPSSYTFTVNLGANGVRLDGASTRFAVLWKGKPLQTVAVVQPQTPLCSTKVVRTQAHKVTVQPKLIGGDREFMSNGPRMVAKVEVERRPESLTARLDVSARETTSDWSAAEGHLDDTYYRPEPGWSIQELRGRDAFKQDFLDTENEIGSLDAPADAPVGRITFYGDHEGEDIGSYTKVDFSFRPQEVVLVQSRGCVRPFDINWLDKAHLISTMTKAKLLAPANKALMVEKTTVLQP